MLELLVESFGVHKNLRPLFKSALATNLLVGQNLVDRRSLLGVLVEAKHDEVVDDLLQLVFIVGKWRLDLFVLNHFLQLLEVLALERVLQRAHFVEKYS